MENQIRLALALKKIKEHVDDRTSLILAKKKTIDELDLSGREVQMIQDMEEYKIMKKEYLTRNRQAHSWNYKLING